MNDVPDFYAGWAANGGDYSDSRSYDNYPDIYSDNYPDSEACTSGSQNDVTYRAPHSASEANSLICELKAEKERFDLFVSVCDSKIDFYKRQKNEAQATFDSEQKYKESLLGEYIKTAPCKKAQNSESLKLPDGTVRRTFATVKLVPDEDKLIKAYRGSELVESVEKLKWGELKKRLAYNGGNIIDTATGEVVFGVTAEPVEEKVSVQF